MCFSPSKPLKKHIKIQHRSRDEKIICLQLELWMQIQTPPMMMGVSLAEPASATSAGREGQVPTAGSLQSIKVFSTEPGTE